MILVNSKANLAIFVLIILFAMCTVKQPDKNGFINLHKKANSFYTSNPDSTLFYARKMLKIAKDSNQRYCSFYLIGYSAEQLNMRDLALSSFKKSLKNSPKNKVVKCKLAIGSQLFSLGKNKEALKIANECLDSGNSYALDLKAKILIAQGLAKSSIPILKKSLSLKNKRFVGFSYQQVAHAFFRSSQIDSAISYQRKAVTEFPLKSNNDRAKMTTTLAKYLIVGKQIKSGLEWLNKAENIEGLSNQSKALIESIKVINEQSEVSLARLETLTEVLISGAQSENDKLAEIKSAIDRYNDILSVHPANFIKTRCKTHIKDFKIYLEGVESGIQKGSIEGSLITEIFPNNTIKINPKKQSKWPPIIFVIVLILATVYLVISRFRKSKDKPDNRRVLIKKASAEINRIESLTKTKISEENKYIIGLLKEGYSFKEVSTKAEIKEDTIRKRMSRLAKKANKNDIRHLFT